MSRIVTGTANCRDLLGLARGFRRAARRKGAAAKMRFSTCSRSWQAAIDPLTDLRRPHRTRAIVDDPPLTVREGGIIRKGASEEADQSAGHHGGRQAAPLPPLKRQEREKTGIRTLKVGFNRVFGYYIEVSKSYYRSGARELHPQADPRQLRALHHPGAERAGKSGAYRQGPAHRAGIPDLHPASGIPCRSRPPGCSRPPPAVAAAGHAVQLSPPVAVQRGYCRPEITLER